MKETSYSTLLTALAFARTAQRDLLETANNPSTPLGQLAWHELATNASANVQKAFAKGDLLAAVSSAFASEEFQQGFGRMLHQANAPVLEVLNEEFQPVLDGVSQVRVKIVNIKKASHLPRTRIVHGQLHAEDSRELLSAALADPFITALWIAKQSGQGNSAPMGWLIYAVNNSQFVNRTRIYGATVELRQITGELPEPLENLRQEEESGTTSSGKQAYHYIHRSEVDQTINPDSDLPDDTLVSSPLDKVALREYQENREPGDFEYALHQLTCLSLDEAGWPKPGAVFNDMYALLLSQPPKTLDVLRNEAVKADHSLLMSGAQAKRLSKLRGVQVEEVTALAQALIMAVRQVDKPLAPPVMRSNQGETGSEAPGSSLQAVSQDVLRLSCCTSCHHENSLSGRSCKPVKSVSTACAAA